MFNVHKSRALSVESKIIQRMTEPTRSKSFSAHPLFVQNLTTIRRAPKRTLAGILIILFSSVIGGLVFQQQKAEIWAVQLTRDVGAGDRLLATDLVRIAIPSLMGTPQWIGDIEDVTNTFATHKLPEGALLLAGDFATKVGDGVRLALSIDSDQMPDGVQTGQYVNLWRVTSETSNAQELSTEVVVLSLNSDASPGKIVMTVKVPEKDVAMLLSAGDHLRLTASM